MYYSLPAQLFLLSSPPVCLSCPISPLLFITLDVRDTIEILDLTGFQASFIGSDIYWCANVSGWWGGGRQEWRAGQVEFPLISDEWFNCWCISVLKEIGDLNDQNRSSHILLQFVGFLLAKCARIRYLHCSTVRGGLCDKANQHPLSIHHSNQVYGSQSMHASNSCKALDWYDKINWLKW